MPDVIDKALIIHSVIKKRLCEAINDPSSANPENVRSDRTCAFGLWIYGPDGMRQSWRPEFMTLKIIHQSFHEATYQAMLATQDGRLAEAQESIKTGDFELCSREMVRALIELKLARQGSPT